MPATAVSTKARAAIMAAKKIYALDVARQLRPLLQAQRIQSRDDARERRFRSAGFAGPHRECAPAIPSSSASISTRPIEIRMRPASRFFRSLRAARPRPQDDDLALSFINLQNGSPVDAQSFELSASVYHSMLGHMPSNSIAASNARASPCFAERRFPPFSLKAVS